MIERMSDLQLGAGPYYAFFRPYHLTSLEVPLSAAAAVLHGVSHMRPLATPVAEVGARAKRELEPGQKLDAIGEYCYRGFALSRTDEDFRLAVDRSLSHLYASGKVAEVYTQFFGKPDAAAIAQFERNALRDD